MNNIENKVIVITGASSGLGEATARLMQYWQGFQLNIHAVLCVGLSK